MDNMIVLLGHGSGGVLTHELVEEVILDAFRNPYLEPLGDSAILKLGGVGLAFTTDSFVVEPIFFNGGDIGRLAICGTVNDLVMAGARPLYLTCSFIIEEGLPLMDLKRVLASMREAASEAHISVVAGDTKVVRTGQADRLYINTAGLGIIENGLKLSPQRIVPGDRLILSGTIGDHGIAVLTQREGLSFETTLSSDCAPLSGLVAAMLGASPNIRLLRDPTRGGLATILKETALASGKAVVIDEASIPIREEVLGACDMLGFDPLYVANEGKLVAVVAREDAERVLEEMQNHKYGTEARIIGEVRAEPAGSVILRTRVGGARLLNMLTGEQLPRIC